MPGSIQNAAPATVMPQTLCRAFGPGEQQEEAVAAGKASAARAVPDAPRFLRGAATTGKYSVRFDGEWSQDVGPGLADASIELIELIELA